MFPKISLANYTKRNLDASLIPYSTGNDTGVFQQ